MARLTRAETLTGSNRRLEYFSDFLTSFAKTPVGDQLARVTNDRAIQQSLKNLIFTNLGERLFQPFIGSNVNTTLFENNVPEDLDTLEFYIENTIKNNERRVNLLGTTVALGNSEHEVVITIVYNTINSPEPVTFEFLLKRVR